MKIQYDNLHKVISKILFKDDYIDPPDFHYNILDFFLEDKRQVAVFAPVGFAKSLISKTYLVGQLLEGKKLQLLVSSSYGKVVLQMTSLFGILKDPLLQSIFNYEVINQNETEVIIKKNGEKQAIYGKTAGSDVLGINFEGYRPYNILIDDIEEQEQVNSMLRTNKLINWLEVTLFSRLPSLTEGNIRLIGTNLGENSLVDQIIKEKQTNWLFKKYPALNNGKSLWEQRFPVESLLKEQKEKPFSFAANYMNEPMLSSDRLFAEDQIGYYDYIGLDKLECLFAHADTTHTAKQSSDFFAWCLGGREKETGIIYIIDILLTKELTPQQQREFIINQFKKHPKLKKVSYDKVSNDGFEQDVVDQARKEGLYLSKDRWEGIKYPSDKFTHILRHEDLIKSKTVLFPKNNPYIHLAIGQLTRFTKENVKLNANIADDFVDSLSGFLDHLKEKKSTTSIYFELLKKKNEK